MLGKPTVMSLSHAEGQLWDYSGDDMKNKATIDAEFIMKIKTTYPEVNGILIKDLDLKVSINVALNKKKKFFW